MICKKKTSREFLWGVKKFIFDKTFSFIQRGNGKIVFRRDFSPQTVFDQLSKADSPCLRVNDWQFHSKRRRPKVLN